MRVFAMPASGCGGGGGVSRAWPDRLLEACAETLPWLPVRRRGC